jgi:segregation and condensation protein B
METEDQKRETEESGQQVAVAEQLTLAAPADETGLKAAIEAIVYVCEEPATAAQIATALQQPPERVEALLAELVAEYAAPAHGLMVREVAGGYKMASKPEHHEAVRAFAKSLKPPLKLSLAALETLATIAYKQPVTAPEIMEIRGVQGAGVLKTLLDRKLIQTAGRKNVVGRPILYKTSKEFLLQFGLKDLSELPTLKEFEELRRLASGDEPENPEPQAARPEPPAAPEESRSLSPDAAAALEEPQAAMPQSDVVSEGAQAPSEESGAAPHEPPAASEEPEATPQPAATNDEPREDEHKSSEPEAASPEPEAAATDVEAAPQEPQAAPEPTEGQDA